MKQRFLSVLAISSVAFCANAMAADEKKEEAKPQASIVGAELSAIANQLGVNPDMAIDFTDVSGEYCFDVGLGDGAHMTHYAVDPSSTQEDVIDFVNAQPLLDAGADLTKLPKFPGGLGTMEQNVWYVLAQGEHDPHHGTEWPWPLLMRASNIN